MWGAIIAFLALVGLVWLGVALVRRARRGGKGVQAIGAALMMFGWGHMRDPRNDTVAEAKDGRVAGARIPVTRSTRIRSSTPDQSGLFSARGRTRLVSLRAR